MIQNINGIEYKLKLPFDMSFISRYGSVFKVFDNQDSGNICFGVSHNSSKYFIKFAGAQTTKYNGTKDNAIIRLKKAVQVYKDLKHDNLIKYLDSEEIGNGFAIIFEWVDAECMGKQYPKSREKFFKLNTDSLLKCFNSILDFHSNTIKKGYVAVDFYDGSIIYDFKACKLYICDIDLYQKQPFKNNMGRMWGSSRFMSPEEFSQGASIDEITNVYLMGATAFVLFGGEADHSFNRWKLNKASYQIALKAVNPDRNQRYQSISTFIQSWQASLLI